MALRQKPGDDTGHLRLLQGRRPPLSVVLLVAAALVVLAVAFPSFYRTSPPSPPVPPSPTFLDDGISTNLDLASLGVTIAGLGWSSTAAVGSDTAARLALATASASALLPPGAPDRGSHHVAVGTMTMLELSSPQWSGTCVCWMVTVVVDPTPPLAIACVAANPPVYSEQAVVLIDAVSGQVRREALGGGQPWVAGHGCPPFGFGRERS